MEININKPTIVGHVKKIEKVEKLDKSVLYKLDDN